MHGVSLTDPMLDSFLPGELILHIPCWLLFCFSFFLLLFYFIFAYLGSFPNTSRSGFIFIWVVSLTHPILASYLLGEFLLHIPCWLLRFVVVFGLSGDLLLHIPFSLHFFLGSPLTHSFFLFFSIFFFFSFLSGEFLLYIPCWLKFYRGNFSYTFGAGSILMWGVSLTHPLLFSFLSGVSLTHPVLTSVLLGQFLLSPFLTGRMFVCRTYFGHFDELIRFLTELLVRRTWFGQFDELYFVFIWLVMRCKFQPELAEDAQQTAWSKM